MSKKEKARAQEERIADKLGIDTVAGSGSTPFLKGDNIAEDLLVEDKTREREQKSIKIKREWFDKAKKQAHSMRKLDYMIAISFGDDKDYFIAEDGLMVDMYKAYKVVNSMLEEFDSLESGLLDSDEEKAVKEFLRRFIN